MPLYDIVIADPTQVDALAASNSPLSLFAGFSCRPIDHVKLANLFVSLDVASFDEALDAMEPVASGSENGPFVSQLPRVFLDTLSTLDSIRLSAIAAEWGNSEEFVLDGIGAGEAQQFIRSLAALWQQAKGDSRSLFLWSAL